MVFFCFFFIGAIYLLILFRTFEMVLLSALSQFSLNFVHRMLVLAFVFQVRDFLKYVVIQNVFCIWEWGTKMMLEALCSGWSLLTYGLSSKVTRQRCGTFDWEDPKNVSICRCFLVWDNFSVQKKTSRFLLRKSRHSYQYVRSWVGQEKWEFYSWEWIAHFENHQSWL